MPSLKRTTAPREHRPLGPFGSAHLTSNTRRHGRGTRSGPVGTEGQRRPLGIPLNAPALRDQRHGDRHEAPGLSAPLFVVQRDEEQLALYGPQGTVLEPSTGGGGGYDLMLGGGTKQRAAVGGRLAFEVGEVHPPLCRDGRPCNPPYGVFLSCCLVGTGRRARSKQEPHQWYHRRLSVW